MHHPGLAGRWSGFSLAEQLGHVGSEVSRAARWEEREAAARDLAMERALELFDLVLADARWRGRLRELARAREVLCSAWVDPGAYATTLKDMDRYFFFFALLARSQRVSRP